MTLPVPLEDDECIAFKQWLDIQVAMGRLRYFHIPNETGHSAEAKRRAIRVKRLGGQSGVHDYIILIFAHAARYGEGIVLSLEMKRQRDSYPSKEQRDWLDVFNSIAPNVMGVWSKGAEVAIAQVKDLMKGTK